jgi:hypothetical protein
MCILLTFLDLENLRQIPSKEAKSFAKKNNMAFFEASARSNTNVVVSNNILLHY